MLPVLLYVAAYVAKKSCFASASLGAEELLLDAAGKLLVVNINENTLKYFCLLNRG